MKISLYVLITCFSIVLSPTAQTQVYLHSGDAVEGRGATNASMVVRPTSWTTICNLTAVDYRTGWITGAVLPVNSNARTGVASDGQLLCPVLAEQLQADPVDVSAQIDDSGLLADEGYLSIHTQASGSLAPTYGRDEIALIQPVVFDWYFPKTNGTFIGSWTKQWGQPGDILLSGEPYNGIGFLGTLDEFVSVRPNPNLVGQLMWTVLDNNTFNTYSGTSLGMVGDVCLVGRLVGDGNDHATVWRWGPSLTSKLLIDVNMNLNYDIGVDRELAWNPGILRPGDQHYAIIIPGEVDGNVAYEDMYGVRVTGNRASFDAFRNFGTSLDTLRRGAIGMSGPSGAVVQPFIGYFDGDELADLGIFDPGSNEILIEFSGDHDGLSSPWGSHDIRVGFGVAVYNANTSAGLPGNTAWNIATVAMDRN